MFLILQVLLFASRRRYYMILLRNNFFVNNRTKRARAADAGAYDVIQRLCAAELAGARRERRRARLQGRLQSGRARPRLALRRRRAAQRHHREPQ